MTGDDLENVINGGILSQVYTINIGKVINISGNFAEVDCLGDLRDAKEPNAINVPVLQFGTRTNNHIVEVVPGDIVLLLYTKYDISVFLETEESESDIERQFNRDSCVALPVVFPTKLYTYAAAGNTINGDTELNGKLTASGIIKSLSDVLAKAISLFGHKHGEVTKGGDDTGVPK